eukprot:10757942-Heterocapsa_arctica.AAC.1
MKRNDYEKYYEQLDVTDVFYEKGHRYPQTTGRSARGPRADPALAGWPPEEFAARSRCSASMRRAFVRTRST